MYPQRVKKIKNNATSYIALVSGAVMALLALVSLSEALSVYQDGTDYTWSAEGPFTWNYQTRKIYIISNIIGALLYFIVSSLMFNSVFNRTKKSYLVAWLGFGAVVITGHIGGIKFLTLFAAKNINLF